MTAELEAVDRMFRVLVRTIRTKHPSLLTEPFSVADLQQQILPYRHFRRDLGLESNQEYELTLMQLLSGAKNYVEVDHRLREEFGRELASGSPQLSRIREFGDASVWLNQDAASGVAMAGTPVSSPVQPPPSTADSGRGADASSSSARCRFCGGELPKTGAREINFCPHCGQNLRVRHCPACGAETEEGWKFCVSCGKGLS
jgi:hypothetical protein